ncbi:Chitin-binding, domain 3 [Kalmanozyma brasiliensis GHG001]|uniref:Chitin-binding type-4 domain-containing protein n=1 Tax=Kalmanozyma brasiliensis (strain GHG001) TaxID=1365824 RepID=V5GQN2_KALBG|nr:Chitin-binding, domain 3 [Kalmanozyma brasiliensis GHG001]EST08257.1 Chitin-binding, domain 3 [Kalmanozyma brasiliensis GHG001]
MSLSLFQLIALVAALSQLLVGSVHAHGFINSPASRSYMCKTGQAKNCGEIQYEPQSVEAAKGLPFARSSNGKLCSAGLSQFSELDRQGASVWPKTQASDVRSFTWTFTAQHATTDFKYYITKPTWNSATSQGLSASDFESEPFLTVPMYGKPPSASMSHDLSSKMPSRSGYHVVYAVWTVDNTVNAFYQCMDLDFGGGNSRDTASAATSTGSSPVASSSSSSAASTSTTSSAAAAAPSSGSSNTVNNDTPKASPAPASGSTGSSSGNSGNGNSSNGSSGGSHAATPSHKNHAAKGTACRMKRRRAPSGSLLAARANYRRHAAVARRQQQP